MFGLLKFLQGLNEFILNNYVSSYASVEIELNNLPIIDFGILICGK